MSRLQNSCWTYSDHKTSPLGPQKDNDNPKIKSNSNVRIQGIIEYEICSTTRVEPKTIVELYSDPQTSPLGLQKNKNNPKN